MQRGHPHTILERCDRTPRRTLSSGRTLPMALHSVTGAITQEIGDRAGVGLLHRCSGCSSSQLAARYAQ
ncbi:hypothetical protein [Nodosilinea sp. E11]|uniref:hypothetical protein n=1 Tax=Nodosilinea sp. E11 TaxID=3037479 RepID=UPI002934F3AF|nr:hypothetical protein [Nodosilinea sp. E11]WOD39703.1 hypothetical protein RRF56_26215 [Nodosilinea sp. E11]WOD39711.1 hypothetical protein RRF56_02740 [Nodosilinea sp. E11]